MPPPALLPLAALAALAAAADPLAGLRRDLVPVAVGIFLAGIGMVAAALALAFWRRRDRALLWLALCTAGYGVRLATERRLGLPPFGLPPASIPLLDRGLTYLLPIGFLLVLEALIGPGWKRSLRRLWQIQLAFTAVALPIEVARGTSAPFARLYQILLLTGLVVVFVQVYGPGLPGSPDVRRLRAAGLALGLFVVNENLESLGLVPWRLSIEWVGFLGFLAVLGSIAARRVLASQQRLAGLQGELATARKIQASILPAAPPPLAGLDLAVRYVPAAEVAGDFYDFLPVDDRRLTLLVADVSGHGVPAALIASMVKVAAAAQAEQAASPARVLTGMGRIFHGKLRNQFITAACLGVDLATGRLLAASAGHPPPLLWRAATGQVEELPPGGPVLGRLARVEYRETAAPLAAGDRVLLFTDGIPEARDPAGEPFGDERLRDLLAAHAGLAAEPLAAALLARIVAWTGRGGAGEEGFEDDLTVVVLGVEESAG